MPFSSVKPICFYQYLYTPIWIVIPIWCKGINKCVLRRNILFCQYLTHWKHTNGVWYLRFHMVLRKGLWKDLAESKHWNLLSHPLIPKFSFSLTFNNSKKGKITAAWLICLYKKKYLFQNIPAIVIGKSNRKIPSFQKNLFPLCLIKLKVQGRLEEKSEPIPTSLFFQCQRLFHQTF